MKIYEKYKELKKRNPDQMYLFKSGRFYIFIGEDADKINEYMVLKRTPFTKDTMKCGFPIQSLEDYIKVFHNHGLNIEVIEPEENNPLKILENISLDSITPFEALQILYELKDKIK